MYLLLGEGGRGRGKGIAFLPSLWGHAGTVGGGGRGAEGVVYRLNILEGGGG